VEVQPTYRPCKKKVDLREGGLLREGEKKRGPLRTLLFYWPKKREGQRLRTGAQKKEERVTALPVGTKEEVPLSGPGKGSLLHALIPLLLRRMPHQADRRGKGWCVMVKGRSSGVRHLRRRFKGKRNNAREGGGEVKTGRLLF